ncbi:gamma-aminobutyric-acid receptor subunit beta [Vibrio sp. SCSIO 43132]|uniref:gamma-aminobutyric-acid receptor subunit beta n=1 Tax=Vibrio sp. SCSIO 43132 TaxID=2779363 RepID=UPI001CA7D189|nr:gamma-aminobutyric-acid receptor subunit beta [Vibrio sp. SCSIO 43132]UAB69958.1 gamma-aminobutyric-acid receptor subunit beta [Vibrio sp. SCSIO 43132]
MKAVLTLLFMLNFLPFSSLAQQVIHTSFSINKIYGVNTIDQTYKIDGYLVATWQDPNHPLKPKSGIRRIENRHLDRMLEDGSWMPAFEFINIIGQRLTPNKRLVITDEGGITYNERFQGTFTTEMDFRRFPFDNQSFEIIMEPFSFDQQSLKFGDASVFVEEMTNKTISEWEMDTSSTAKVSRHSYHHLDSAESTDYSRLTVTIDATRKPNYYLWQFILPLSLILIASWAVFWIEGFSERLMTSFTMMLTVVAYTFYTSSLLPRLPYTTFIERMIIMGYVSIFAAILIIVFVKIREERGKPTHGLIPYCRSIFPTFFLAAIAILIGVNSQL